MRDEKASILGRIGLLGLDREHAIAVIASSRQTFAELAVQARDAGATVQEIADAYGVTRPGVYEAVKAARAGADSEVNGTNEIAEDGKLLEGDG